MAIRMIENTWIPLADGTRLAARIWLPDDAEQRPVPAILEYLPYRKNDGTALRDSRQHPYVAAHGYAVLRVDMRGSGDADGIMLDEYLKQEQDDALEVIDWIARQPWCTGAVGMYGISWGGFNGLQVAARRPPALKAIITLCSTDDRYADDVHYMGGCVDYDMLPWASAMLIYNAGPPDPRFVGEGWRAMWHERLEKTPPYSHAWMSHQRRDAYWQHGSVCESFDDITCAVYAVGGWADGYTNAVPRLLAGLNCPRKGLIGPWPHAFPHDAEPGPVIGWLQECVRWWDHWLKGIDTGLMAEPMLRAWVQNSVPPRTSYAERPGYWAAEDRWPSPRIEARALHLTHELQLAAQPAPHNGSPLRIGTDLSHGMDSGVWCGYGYAGEMAGDQRAEDGRALSFTGAPAEAAIDILGFPRAQLTLSADKPQAQVAVRLCDVAPTGESLLVSFGVLNLTHRDSHEHPQPLQPGQRYTVEVTLNAIGHRLPPGHRWRLSVAPSYWPMIWPAPEPVVLSIDPANSQLILPVRPPNPADAALPAFKPVEEAPALATRSERPSAARRVWTLDRASGALTLDVQFDYGATRYVDSNLLYDETWHDTYSITPGDPLSARVICRRTLALGAPENEVRITSHSEMSCSAGMFHLTDRLTAREASSDAPAIEKHWRLDVPRDA